MLFLVLVYFRNNLMHLHYKGLQSLAYAEYKNKKLPVWISLPFEKLTKVLNTNPQKQDTIEDLCSL